MLLPPIKPPYNVYPPHLTPPPHRDRKLNPFQHTAKKLRKMVTKVVKMEKAMFPEQFKGLFDDDKLVGDVSDNEW